MKKLYITMVRKHPKIGIVGFFGYGNAGDEAMKEILLNHFPNSFANNQGNLPKCDAYIYAGGNLVQGKTGLHMAEILQKVTNEPLYMLSLGAQEGWEAKKGETQKYLSKFRMIFVRDKKSKDELSGITKITGLMPDLVLLADAPADHQEYPILFNYTERPRLHSNGQYQDVLKQAKMLPVALSSRDFDTKYSKKVVDYKTFISMAKSSRGVIGTRLHAVVMGVIANVPVVGIAYEDKVGRFCQRYDISCFDYGQRNGEQIVSALRIAKIDLAAERIKIMQAINLIKKDLEKNFS